MPAGTPSSRRWLFLSVAMLVLCLALAWASIVLAWQQTSRTRQLQTEALRADALRTAQRVQSEIHDQIATILELVAASPDDGAITRQLDAHPWLTHACIVQGDRDHFVPPVPQPVEAVPPLDEAPIWLLEARQLETVQRQPREAIALYQRCLTPATPPVWQRQARLAIARCHQKLNEPRQAMTIYENLLEEASPTADRLTPALALLDTLAETGDTESRRRMIDRLVGEARTQQLTFLDRSDVERFIARVEGIRTEEQSRALAQELLDQMAIHRLELRFRYAVEVIRRERRGSPADATIQFYRETHDTEELLIAYKPASTSLDARPFIAGRIAPTTFFTAVAEPAFARLSPPDLHLISSPAEKPAGDDRWSVPLLDVLPDRLIAPADAFVNRLRDATRRQRAISVILTTATLGALVIALYLALRAIRRDLEFARLQSEFIAGVSHELKTPLALIRMYSETLREGRIHDAQKQSHYHEVIARESESLSAMIDSLLDFSARQVTGRSYELRSVTPDEILHPLIQRYDEYLKQQGFTVTFDIQPALPPIHADPHAVTQALANLIDNAVKYSPGEKHLTISASVTDDGRYVMFRVADLGLGIAEDDRKRLFEPFFRGTDARIRRTRGNGLGLAFVKHMADAHRARVTLESRLDHGTTVRISIPVAGT